MGRPTLNQNEKRINRMISIPSYLDIRLKDELNTSGLISELLLEYFEKQDKPNKKEGLDLQKLLDENGDLISQADKDRELRIEGLKSMIKLLEPYIENPRTPKEEREMMLKKITAAQREIAALEGK